MWSVDNPLQVFDDLHRLLVPGGLACIVEPDLDSLVIDPTIGNVNDAFRSLAATTMLPHSNVGRKLARLSQACGFTVLKVLATSPVIRDFDTADSLLNIRWNLSRVSRAR
jgi:hypothetical protein